MSAYYKAAMETNTNNRRTRCEECGAPRVEGMSCWEQMGAILAWEYRDPELAAQHFLTVASYNLQHPAQFTDEALSGLRASFIDYLDNGVPASELRRRASRAYEGSKRVLKPESECKPVLRTWDMTVTDVYIPNQPKGAAARVKSWADSIRKEL